VTGTVCVTLSDPHAMAEWRDAARRCVQARVPPARVQWQSCADGGGDLFAAADALPEPNPNAAPVRANQEFLRFAASVLLHTDPARHAILYDILWRMQTKPRLLSDASDAMVRRANLLAKAVGRDIHKMRAFVRFREVEDAGGAVHYVAWFEPQFAILRANAKFFVGRFATMRWTILTPIGSIHWDGEALHEGPAADQSQAPADDPAEDLWRTYYASIFNPARLKVKAMVKEMPKRYWKNLPEASLIPGLIAGAQAREAAMVTIGSDAFADVAEPESLADIAAGIANCTRCAIGCNGTRAVMGHGPQNASLMLLGEAPGDQEEVNGRPFVGPAGQLLRAHLADASIAAAAYMTSAVKHFKYEQHGKIRLHKNPSANEIDMCRWWLEREIELVNPRLIVALGASAARALTGRTVSVTQARGRFIPLSGGRQMLLTFHPSYLLRIDAAAREDVERAFSADLALARDWLARG
jgi:uracil-DNA glycosylase